MDYWPHFQQAASYPVPPRKLFGREPKVFTMGSCFAIEIRRAFQKLGLVVYPDYPKVDFDSTRQVYDKIPPQKALMHYDTFSILQEFECAFGVWTDRAASFCEVRDAPANALFDAPVVYKDPTRRMIYGRTREDLADLSAKIDAVVREGIATADLFVITLGLTEAWRHKLTGRYFGAQPSFGLGGDVNLAEFVQSGYPENYANVRMMVDLLLKHCPNKPIVISVSPIHLECTFAGTDVGSASMESKCILRAVAGKVVRDFAGRNVHYFPAYEMAHFSKEPVYTEGDGRHVRPEFAARVVGTFIASYGAGA